MCILSLGITFAPVNNTYKIFSLTNASYVDKLSTSQPKVITGSVLSYKLQHGDLIVCKACSEYPKLVMLQLL